MNNLLNGIESSIKNAFEEFSKIISIKYDIDSEELENIWNSVSTDMKISIVIKNENVNKAKISSPKKKVEISSDECPYTFTRGDNKDTKCGSKTKSGCIYCSRHKKFEEIGQPEKETKKMPQSKTISGKAAPKKTSPPKKQIDKTLRLNKEIDKFWHPESELIFKSKDERIVIGSYKDGKINKLTNDDIMMCEQYGFKYLMKDEEVEEVEEVVVDNKVKKSKKEVDAIVVDNKAKKSNKEEVVLDTKVNTSKKEVIDKKSKKEVDAIVVDNKAKKSNKEEVVLDTKVNTSKKEVIDKKSKKEVDAIVIDKKSKKEVVGKVVGKVVDKVVDTIISESLEKQKKISMVMMNDIESVLNELQIDNNEEFDDEFVEEEDLLEEEE